MTANDIASDSPPNDHLMIAQQEPSSGILLSKQQPRKPAQQPIKHKGLL